jgi:hypothetical protein
MVMESEIQRSRDFTAEVARHIEASEFTTAEVAHELHINPEHLELWLAGTTPMPWMRALEILDLLGVSLGRVMADA